MSTVTSQPFPSDVIRIIEAQRELATIQPLHDRVLVRRDPPKQVLGSILIPDQAKENATQGTVIAVGPGKRLTLIETGEEVFWPTVLKPGDRIVFTLSVNVDYPDLVSDGDLVMMSEQDVIGVIG